MGEVTPDSTETRTLLREAAAGNWQAFEQLMTRHRSSLHRFVELRLDGKMRARIDASDVVQEAQLDVFRRLSDFLRRQPMPFQAWLRKTTYQRLLMLRRKHVEASRRAAGREVPLPERSSALLAQRFLKQGSTPSQRAAKREQIRRVQQALAQLPQTDHEILFMRNFEELSYQEIGYVLDLEPAAARKRHGRALLRLHKLLAQSGFTESQL